MKFALSLAAILSLFLADVRACGYGVQAVVVPQAVVYPVAVTQIVQPVVAVQAYAYPVVQVQHIQAVQIQKVVAVKQRVVVPVVRSRILRVRVGH